jgi:hypothetical protein
MDNIFKSDSISAAPIRVINLLYNSGVWYNSDTDSKKLVFVDKENRPFRFLLFGL